MTALDILSDAAPTAPISYGRKIARPRNAQDITVTINGEVFYGFASIDKAAGSADHAAGVRASVVKLGGVEMVSPVRLQCTECEEFTLCETKLGERTTTTQKHRVTCSHWRPFAESEETGVTCSACSAKERRQKSGPVATTMLHADDCPVVRAACHVPDVKPRQPVTTCSPRRHLCKCGCRCACGGMFNITAPPPLTSDGREVCEACHAREKTRTERRQREAPLVALVAACPEGLDPNGWRAAVLAINETQGDFDGSGVDLWIGHKCTAAVRLFVGGSRSAPDSEAVAWSMQDVAVHAYRRALTPAAKVAPERRSGGKAAPVIVCDAGWED